MKIPPSRSTVTISPVCGSSGRAAARGNRTSTPPCMMGAVIMKMIKSTNATSTRLVTLMSAFRGSSPCPRSPPPCSKPAMLQPPFARHRADQLLGEAFQLAGEETEAIDVEVVGHHGGHGDGEAGDGRHQRFGHAGGNRGDVARATGGDANKGVHHAQHGPEQTEQRADGPERRQP